MADRKWTIMVYSEDGTGLRQFRLSREMVRGAIAIGLLAFSVVVSGLTQLVIRLHGPRQTSKLVRENRALRSKLQQIDGEVHQLNGTLETLSRKDEQFRLMAGLEPLGAEVRLAGIGGPDSEILQQSPLWQVNPEVGASVFRTSAGVSEMARRARLLSLSLHEAHDSLVFHRERLARTPSILPAEGYISSAFSRLRLHPILNRARPHEGIDISAQQGTPIIAAAKGRVKFAGQSGEYGLMVEIDHGFNMITRYAHASRILARVGWEVSRGDTIALIGATGLADGPHVHYEVLVGGTRVNPRKYLMTLTSIPD